MRRRTSSVKIILIFLLTFSFAFVDWCYVVLAAGPDFETHRASRRRPRNQNEHR